MKVAFFTETFLPKVDGIVTRLTKTVKHLVDAGDEVMVFCPEGCPDEYMGARLIGVPAMPLPLYPELKRRLPPRRKPWQPEHPRMAVFEAAAMGIVAQTRHMKETA